MQCWHDEYDERWRTTCQATDVQEQQLLLVSRDCNSESEVYSNNENNEKRTNNHMDSNNNKNDNNPRKTLKLTLIDLQLVPWVYFIFFFNIFF